MQDGLALLRIEPLEELICSGSGVERSHIVTNLPLRCDTLCAGTAGSGTLVRCFVRSGDFSTGTGLRCPWSSCFPYSPAVRNGSGARLLCEARNRTEPAHNENPEDET
ncbi:hypothetical protein MDUV_52800 [Mycolicibacterium duvalii]|uniref:Uncharacterized protein n=1 Tax=Mycolicibacterium duvalii TaxID=39688 RepID=A0A7I7K8A7_9MYCO|nr:hypothetical protein MDUV_52800 [Mycolicibacterium duvalii]